VNENRLIVYSTSIEMFNLTCVRVCGHHMTKDPREGLDSADSSESTAVAGIRHLVDFSAPSASANLVAEPFQASPHHPGLHLHLHGFHIFRKTSTGQQCMFRCDYSRTSGELSPMELRGPTLADHPTRSSQQGR
jgi:hypothetical protein